MDIRDKVAELYPFPEGREVSTTIALRSAFKGGSEWQLEQSIGSVLAEVSRERQRQIDLGYTPEHDNNAGLLHLLIETMDRLDKPGAYITHQDLVQAAALLVAAAEVI